MKSENATQLEKAIQKLEKAFTTAINPDTVNYDELVENKLAEPLHHIAATIETGYRILKAKKEVERDGSPRPL